MKKIIFSMFLMLILFCSCGEPNKSSESSVSSNSSVVESSITPSSTEITKESKTSSTKGSGIVNGGVYSDDEIWGSLH